MPQLYIGNKNYSSWSMRPWVLLRQAGIAFEEMRVRFDSFDAGSEFKRTVGPVSPTGKVPVLVDGDLVVWDTLAIAEYLAETYPDKKLWPQDKAARARAQAHLRQQTLQRQYPGLPDPAGALSAAATPWPDQDAADLPVAHWAQLILADNHELELAQARAEQAQLQAQRAQLEQRGDPTLGVRATRERSGQEKVWGVYVSIPLGGAGRKADFEAALAQAEVALQEQEQVRQRVEIQAWRTASEAEQARTTRQQMQRALARIQQSAALQARAYELGESPLADLLLARRNALEAQLAADTASLDAMQAHAKVLLDAHRLWSIPGTAGH